MNCATPTRCRSVDWSTIFASSSERKLSRSFTNSTICLWSSPTWEGTAPGGRHRLQQCQPSLGILDLRHKHGFRTPSQPIGQACSSETVSLSQVAQQEEFNNRKYEFWEASPRGLLCGTLPWPWQQLSFYFWFVTSVDLNTVQVTNMVQLNSFVLEDCHKAYFTLRGSYRRMEAHNTCTSERKSGRSFIERSLLSLMSLTIFSLQHLELIKLQPWLVSSAGEFDCKYPTVIFTGSTLCSCCDLLCTQFCCCSLRCTKRT